MHGVLWRYRCRAWLGLENGATVAGILYREAWWQGVANVQLNERQRKMLRLLLGDFKGKLTSGKWTKIYKALSDVALCNINGLIAEGRPDAKRTPVATAEIYASRILMTGLNANPSL